MNGEIECSYKCREINMFSAIRDMLPLVSIFFCAILGQRDRDSNRRIGIERISLADFIKLIRILRYACPFCNYGRGNAPRNPWKLEKLRILGCSTFRSPICLEGKKKSSW